MVLIRVEAELIQEVSGKITIRTYGFPHLSFRGVAKEAIDF